jgi:hypothetical protein
VIPRIVAPTLATAVVTSGLAVAVNLATEWKTEVWAWLVVAGLTVLSFVATLWLYRRQTQSVDRIRDEEPMVVNTQFNVVRDQGKGNFVQGGDQHIHNYPRPPGDLAGRAEDGLSG